MINESILVKFQTYLLTEKLVARNSFGAYRGDLRQLSIFLYSRGLVLTKLNKHDIKAFIYYLKHDLKLSARTIARKISCYKVLFTYLNERYGIEDLGIHFVFPKIEEKLPMFLNEEEIENLFTFLNEDNSPLAARNKMLITLLYVSGMRISELVNIKISQIHFDTSLIHIMGKGGKERMVPIIKVVMEEIKNYLMNVVAAITVDKMRKNDYLFPVYLRGKMKPLTRQSSWLIISRLCKNAGIQRPVSPHQFRHSLATHMLKNGADLRSLQLLLGHESIRTVQIYTHIEKSHLRKVYDVNHERA